MNTFISITELVNEDEKLVFVGYEGDYSTNVIIARKDCEITDADFEETLHRLLDNGATEYDVRRITGMTTEGDEEYPVDLGYCLPGAPLATSDTHSEYAESEVISRNGNDYLFNYYLVERFAYDKFDTRTYFKKLQYMEKAVEYAKNLVNTVDNWTEEDSPELTVIKAFNKESNRW